MREPQQPQNINNKIGHERTADLDLPLVPNAPSNHAIATKPQQSLSTTIDPSQLITLPNAIDVRKLNKLTLPINHVHHTHPRTSQRLSHHITSNNTMHDALQNTIKKESSFALATSIPRVGGGSSGTPTTGGGDMGGLKCTISMALGSHHLTISRLIDLLATCTDEQYTKVIHHLMNG